MPTSGLNVDKQDCWHFVFSIYHLNSNSHFSCYVPDCIYYFTYKVTTLVTANSNKNQQNTQNTDCFFVSSLRVLIST